MTLILGLICKKDRIGNSLAVQWLGSVLPLQGEQVQSLVGELKIPQALWHSQKDRVGLHGGDSY